MKLGSETGSLVNHILTGEGQPQPVVGMGATLCSWTDRYPATVQSVNKSPSGRPILVLTEDESIRTDSNGMSECQEYTYKPIPDGRRLFFTKDNRGRWVECAPNNRGRMVYTRRYGLVLGRREAYHDFSF